MKKITIPFSTNRYTVLLLIILSIPNFITAQNPTQVLFEIWDGTTWQSQSRDINTYDPVTGYLSTSTSQELISPPDDWQDTFRETYTNNPDGTVNQMISEIWEQDLGQWRNFERETNTYNASQKLLEKLTESYSEIIDWTFNQRDLYTYDDQNRVTSHLIQRNYSKVINWNDDLQTLYSYNSDGTLNEKLEQRWNFPIANTWNNLRRETFQYNTGGFFQISTEQQWVSGTWVNDNQNAVNIDANNIVTYILFKTWDENFGTYENNSQAFFSSNSAGFFTQIVVQLWNGTDWVNVQRVTYTNNLSTLAFSKESNRVFPNPTNAVLNFQLGNDKVIDEITITDLTGKIVFKQAIKSNQVNVESLAKGVYIIQGQSGDEKFESKFVKL